VANEQADRDFGSALVELEILLLDRVREGMRQQRKAGAEAKSLEQTLVDMSYITAEQAAQVRAHVAKKSPAPTPAEPKPKPKQESKPPPKPEPKPAAVEVTLDDSKSRPGLQNLPGYEILRKIGAGGRGSVFLARQLSFDRQVAIKILTPRLSGDPVYVAQFQKEARTAAKLNHPNIITAFDVGEHQGIHYFVTEYVDGPTARQMLDEKGKLDEKTVVHIALQVAKALEVAHRAGIVHRDVKPENIMVTRDGMVKLCDLGLAREAGGGGAGEKRAAGTPRYMAPEQARGEANLDARSDIYSLGATMYHLVTGEPPFRAETHEQLMAKHVAEPLVPPRVVRPDVSERLNNLIVKMMLKDRSDRYQAPWELVAALQSIADAQKRGLPALPPLPPMAARAPVARRVEPEPASRGGLLFAVAAVAVVCVGLFLMRDRLMALFAKPAGGGPPPRPDAFQTADDAAKRDFDAIVFSATHDQGFEAIGEVLGRFDAFKERHRGTAWEGYALEERAKYVEAADKPAQAALEAIRRKDAPLRGAEKWRDVLRLYAEFPPRFLDTTPSGEECRQETARITQRATEKLAADKAQVSSLTQSRKYADALALVTRMEGYALDSALADLRRQKAELQKWAGQTSSAAAQAVGDKYLTMEVGWREYLARRDFRLAILSIARFLVAEKWPQDQRPHIQVSSVDYAALLSTLESAEETLTRQSDAERACMLWQAASAICEEAAGDPASPADLNTARRALLDLRNAIALELLRHQVVAGLDRLIRGREKIGVETYGGDRGTFEVREAKIVFAMEGKPPLGVDPVRDLQEPDLVAIAARSLDAEPATSAKIALENPKFQLRVGLLYYYSRSGTAYAGRAHEAFLRASERGARGARVYVADLLEVMRKQEEQHLAARFEQATALFGAREYARARSLCEELLRSNATWVAQRRPEIQRMLSEIERAAEGEKRLAEMFRGRVEPVGGGKVKVRYDFEAEAQGEAFEVIALPSRGKWTVARGAFESSKLASAARWRHRITGDVEVEYLLSPQEEPQNIATTLYYNAGQSKHYSVSLAFDLVSGAADPKNQLEDKMSFPRFCVLKHPVAFDPARAQARGEWDKLRERLVGTPRGPDVKPVAGAAYRVRIARAGKAIRVFVDEKAVWEGEDADYWDGFLLFYSDSRVRIDSLAITFKPE